MNHRQAQEQSKRNVRAFLLHLASLPSGSVLGLLELMAKAQFMEGLTGRMFNSLVTRAAKGGLRTLQKAIATMMTDVDPMIDPSSSAWLNTGTSMYKAAWNAANPVVRPYGLEASDVLAEDMVRALSDHEAVEEGASPRGSLFYLAGKAFREKAPQIVSGEIEVNDTLGRITHYSKNLAINFAKHKKVQDKADAAAVAEGMLPGVIQTESGEQYEQGDFDADTMSMGSWGSIIAAVLANPREAIAQEMFDWFQEWVEDTSQLTELEKRIVSTYLLELSTTGTSTSYTELATDFNVSKGFISQLMGVNGRFTSLVSGALMRERPAFLNELDNVRELANLARGGGGAWKAAAADKVAAEERVLRANLIRLAYENPSVRSRILGLLKEAGKSVPSKPMHIGKDDKSATLCGIPSAKAVKQDLPVISTLDAGRIEGRSNWCDKCVEAAQKSGVKVNKKAGDEGLLAGRPWGGKGYKPRAKDYDNPSPGPGSPPCTPEGEGGCYEHTDMYKGYGSANSGTNGSAARREYNKKYRENHT